MKVNPSKETNTKWPPELYIPSCESLPRPIWGWFRDLWPVLCWRVLACRPRGGHGDDAWLICCRYIVQPLDTTLLSTTQRRTRNHCYGHSYVSGTRGFSTQPWRETGRYQGKELVSGCLTQLKCPQFSASTGQSHTHLAQRRIVLGYIYFWEFLFTFTVPPFTE